MELKQVLAQVPGLNRQFVYYLESQGYIRPRKLRRARIARRDYGSEDLRVLQEMWRYYQRGYSVQSAWQLLSQPERLAAYITLPVAQCHWRAALDALSEERAVSSACVVYAGDFDVLLTTDSPDEGTLYHDLLPALAAHGFAGAPTVYKARQTVRKTGRGNGVSTRMMAYVFLKVPGKNVEEVMAELQQIDDVVEAAVVYGETDIIVKVAAADQDALDSLVLDQLHAMPAVESTRTFIVIGRLQWQRPAEPVLSQEASNS